MHLGSVPYKWLVAVAFIAGLFMFVLDSTIVNVALPTLAASFRADSASLEWVVNAYLLSLATWIPASGWVGDRFGTKTTFLVALATFTVGSALCGLSWSIPTLILFRVLQGIGGGMMTPVGTAMLFRAFPPEERASASSVMSIPIAFSPALGPVLGGWLVDYINWRWIFLVNVPVGIATLIFGLRFLREHREKGAGRFDLAGFLLSGIGLLLVLYALSAGPVHGWVNPRVLVSGSLGAVCLTLVVSVERRHANPLLHFSLYQDRLFRLANIIMFFAFAVWIGYLFVIPLFLQGLLGLSAFGSGLTTAPQALGWAAMAALAGRAFHRFGPRRVISSGLVGVLIASVLFVFIDAQTNLWIIRAVMFLRGASMVYVVVPVQAAAFSNISSEETGRASSLFNTNRQVAASLGVALLGTVLFQIEGTQAIGGGQIVAYHAAAIAAAILALAAVVSALRIDDEDAAASLGRRGQRWSAE